jgi:hypothetical protein
VAVCGRTGALDLVLAVILAGERDLLVGAVVEREAAVGEGLVRFGVARAVVQRLLTTITINNGLTYKKCRSGER